MGISVGSQVVLNVPENERLHGKPAKVLVMEEWGAHLECSAAATGKFRAVHTEMVEVSQTNGIHKEGTDGKTVSFVAQPKKRREYTGNICDHCGSAKLIRTGSCETCQDCGTSGGCV